MGVDIHMYIQHNGKFIYEDIFNGRNSEWFANMQGEGWDDVYDELPISYGFPEDIPQEYIDHYKDWTYGHCYIKVEDFLDWFKKYRPDIDAGWFSTYDKWRIEKKGYIPDECPHYLSENDNPADMHFIEVVNKYDCSAWLNNFLLDNQVAKDALIVYCFDH